ncbi:MAG: universal stress protein [Bacteroidota bacterium]
MNKIVVPTDFSKNAASALRYAINIANHFGAHILLIHTYEVQSRTGMLINVRDFIKKDAETDLSKVVKSIKTSLHHGTTLEARAIEGPTVDTICRFAKGVDADMIIMGTQGATGLKGIVMGSIATGVIKTSKLPVLAIPDEFEYRPLKSVTLALDSEVTNNPDILAPLIELCKAYKANIKILHVKKEKTIALVDAGIDTFLSDTPHSFHLVDAEDVNEGITRFVEEEQPDMLCMIRRNRSFFEQLFHSSMTSKKASHTKIPLLVMDDRLTDD